MNWVPLATVTGAARAAGAVRVSGASRAAQAAIVEANSISYPLNQGCGTGLEYTSTVKAWIYDSAGNRSKPVIIYLACTT